MKLRDPGREFATPGAMPAIDEPLAALCQGFPNMDLNRQAKPHCKPGARLRRLIVRDRNA